MIYIADILAKKHPSFDLSFKRKLEEHGEEYQVVANCKDIWLRDFFPTKTINGWQAFRYFPDYLNGYPKERTDIKQLNIPFKYKLSHLTVDGGNIVLSPDKTVAILCDKVIKENPKLGKDDLSARLSKDLGAQIIYIPYHPKDEIGHADGYVRWIDNERILVAEGALDEDHMNQLKSALKDYKLEYLCNYVTDKKNEDGIPSAEGCYINYLETNNLILVPQFGQAFDHQAVEQLEYYFPHKVIDTIDCRSICIDGGVLNCITGG